MCLKVVDFLDEKTSWEMPYMVERWTFVGVIIQRLQIVWIYGLIVVHKLNTVSKKFSGFRDL